MACQGLRQQGELAHWETEEATACHAHREDIFPQPLPFPNSFLPALERPTSSGLILLGPNSGPDQVLKSLQLISTCLPSVRPTST